MQARQCSAAIHVSCCGRYTCAVAGAGTVATQLSSVSRVLPPQQFVIIPRRALQSHIALHYLCIYYLLYTHCCRFPSFLAARRMQVCYQLLVGGRTISDHLFLQLTLAAQLSVIQTIQYLHEEEMFGYILIWDLRTIV